MKLIHIQIIISILLLTITPIFFYLLSKRDGYKKIKSLIITTILDIIILLFLVYHIQGFMALFLILFGNFYGAGGYDIGHMITLYLIYIIFVVIKYVILKLSKSKKLYIMKSLLLSLLLFIITSTVLYQFIPYIDLVVSPDGIYDRPTQLQELINDTYKK